jgi:hypothetical protein
MFPPFPTQCDACSQPLDKALVCSRCKAYAYCVRRPRPSSCTTQFVLILCVLQDAKCQALDWVVHKTRCSALPPLPLVPAKIEPSPERAREVGSVSDLLIAIMDGIWVSPQEAMSGQSGRGWMSWWSECGRGLRRAWLVASGPVKPSSIEPILARCHPLTLSLVSTLRPRHTQITS